MKYGLIFAVLLLSGCATEGYQCDKPAACNPVHHNYEAAQADNDWNGWQAGQPQSGNSHGDDAAPSAAIPPQMQAAMPEANSLDRPVYSPPHPWRVWLAPESRNDGTLESGSYVFFVTPGHWNYMGKEWQAPPFADKGSGDSGVVGENGELQPVSPGDLGFNPGKAVAPQGVLNDISQPKADGE